MINNDYQRKMVLRDLTVITEAIKKGFLVTEIRQITTCAREAQAFLLDMVEMDTYAIVEFPENRDKALWKDEGGVTHYCFGVCFYGCKNYDSYYLIDDKGKLVSVKYSDIPYETQAYVLMDRLVDSSGKVVAILSSFRKERAGTNR